MKKGSHSKFDIIVHWILLGVCFFFMGLIVYLFKFYKVEPTLFNIVLTCSLVFQLMTLWVVAGTVTASLFDSIISSSPWNPLILISGPLLLLTCIFISVGTYLEERRFDPLIETSWIKFCPRSLLPLYINKKFLTKEAFDIYRKRLFDVR